MGWTVANGWTVGTDLKVLKRLVLKSQSQHLGKRQVGGEYHEFAVCGSAQEGAGAEA